jgi:hypothetical protein
VFAGSDSAACEWDPLFLTCGLGDTGDGFLDGWASMGRSSYRPFLSVPPFLAACSRLFFHQLFVVRWPVALAGGISYISRALEI